MYIKETLKLENSGLTMMVIILNMIIAFIENDTTRPISVNMPKDQKTYHSKELFHYFKSILSEGENRKQICKALRIDPDDDWSLLVLTCQYDTIGAITVKDMEHGTM